MRSSTGRPSGGLLPGRRTVAVAMVALLVVLAGCGGLDGTGTTATPGTAPGEEGTVDGTPTPTPEVEPIDAGALPAGVDETGVVNATRLLDAHASEGLSGSYRVRVEPVGADAATDERIVLNQGETRARLVHETADGTTTYWTAAKRGVTALQDRSGQVTYATGASELTADLLDLSVRAETAVDPYLRFGEFEPVGMVELDGQQFVKLRATGIDGSALAASPWRIAGEDGQIAELSGRVLISPAGVVSQAEFEVTMANGDTDTFRYRVGALAEDALAEPAWTGDAPHVEATISEDGKTLELTHRGGEAIPAGAELQLIAGGEVIGTTTVPERVGPDQQLYVVVVVREDDARSLRVGVGERPSVDGHLLSLQRYDGLVAVGTAEGSGFEAGT